MDGGIGGGVEGSCNVSWCLFFFCCCILADANVTRRRLCVKLFTLYLGK